MVRDRRRSPNCGSGGRGFKFLCSPLDLANLALLGCDNLVTILRGAVIRDSFDGTLLPVICGVTVTLRHFASLSDP